MEILIEIGFILNVTDETGKLRCRAKVIGIYGYGFLIVKLFDFENQSQWTDVLKKGQPLVVRYFHDGFAFGFESTIVYVNNYSDSMFFIKYPEEVEKLSIRSFPRVPCLLPAVFEIKGNKTRGSIIDISVSGCKFISSECVSYEKTNDLDRQNAIIWFAFPGSQENVNVSCELKNINTQDGLIVLGIMFTDNNSKLLSMIHSSIMLHLSISNIASEGLNQMEYENTSLPVKNGEGLYIEVEGGHKPVLATLTGVNKGYYLIIKLRQSDLDEQALTKSSVFTVRYTYRGSTFYFTSRFLYKSDQPVELYFIDYPINVEKYSVRSYPRIPCLLPAVLKVGDISIDGSIIDISKNGCKFASDKDVASNMKNPLPGESINVIFKLPGFNDDIKVIGVVKNYTGVEGKSALGILFGVMDKNDGNLLEQYINYHTDIDKRFVDDTAVMKKDCNMARVVVKKVFYLFVGEDIEDGLMWIFNTFFKGLVKAVIFRNYNKLMSNITNDECSLLIIDIQLFEDINGFINQVTRERYTFKLLIFFLDSRQKEDFSYLKKVDCIEDIMARPFTQKDMHGFLFKSFGFGMPKIIKVGLENVKKGLVIADDVHELDGDDVLIEAGTVLDVSHISLLLENRVKHIKVHEGGENFLNCWEFHGCQYYGVCPASTYTDSDGFLGGKNAGRACMYIKNTFSCTSDRFAFEFKTYNEKLDKHCKHCDFYKTFNYSDEQKESMQSLKKYIKDKKLANTG